MSARPAASARSAADRRSLRRLVGARAAQRGLGEHRDRAEPVTGRVEQRRVLVRGRQVAGARPNAHASSASRALGCLVLHRRRGQARVGVGALEVAALEQQRARPARADPAHAGSSRPPRTTPRCRSRRRPRCARCARAGAGARRAQSACSRRRPRPSRSAQRARVWPSTWQCSAACCSTRRVAWVGGGGFAKGAARALERTEAVAPDLGQRGERTRALGSGRTAASSSAMRCSSASSGSASSMLGSGSRGSGVGSSGSALAGTCPGRGAGAARASDRSSASGSRGLARSATRVGRRRRARRRRGHAARRRR